MEGIKYVNFIEISPVVIEIRGVENSELAVPVNNTLVHHMAFLAADTQPCLLVLLLVNGGFDGFFKSQSHVHLNFITCCASNLKIRYIARGLV